ncbi:MAG: LysM peptidoglycan-binding domain-containing protein [Verrucomicrobia bacterium]|nr:LysM peptidoglycan-binding domain-containing protein [Verrucomicrobiota bacterium]
MKKQRRKRGGSTSRGLVGALFKGTQRLPAHVSEEPEWYLDGAEVKLTRVFTIVLILHLVAVGGILAFKMIEKASVPEVIVSTEKDLPAQPESGQAKKATPAGKTAAVKQATKAPLKVERRNPVIIDDPSRKGLSVYRVSSGETLVDIARDQRVSVAELRRLNDLHTGDKLYAGKWLSIPDKKKTVVGNGASSKKEKKVASAPKAKVLKAVPIGNSPKAKPVKAVVAKPVSQSAKVSAAAKKKKVGATYVVKSGDNLYKIARQTGVTYSSLISLNKLDKPELLQVGQVLKIPGN